ncbi:MAG TPA: hypothetical protein DDW52_12330 [Planctomycetaceae bacterium]|nr:hypothetical protein [Planctomycetaceae bacterium]
MTPPFLFRCISSLLSGFILVTVVSAQETTPIETIPALVDFSSPMQEWDGFGFNYVEACQTRDYDNNPQDYGGFSLLDETQRKEIADLVFSPDGLNVDLIKMFLDPWHQAEPEGPFDHAKSTRNMLDFVDRGFSTSEKKLQVLTTLYGPPAWATKQKFIGGRDLDPRMSDKLASYLIDWALFLRDRGINVRHLSIHNEGEDFYRWDHREGTQRLPKFDYNMVWWPNQVNNFIIQLTDEISRREIEGLGVTNGEPSNWTRFLHWGYAQALYDNEDALSRMSLLTTHGFVNGDTSRLSYGNSNGVTTALLRAKRPELHTWITSYSWGGKDFRFLRYSHEHIYEAGVNGLIPWAGIQHPESWIGGDGLGSAFIVHGGDRGYEVTLNYYLYKQLTTAGHAGMRVARTMLANPQAGLFAFAQDDTAHPDAFAVYSNIFVWGLPIGIEIRGSEYTKFQANRTSLDGAEKYADIGTFEVEDDRIVYDAPRGTMTTFIGIK